MAEQLAAPTTSAGAGPSKNTVTRKAVVALVTVLVLQALLDRFRPEAEVDTEAAEAAAMTVPIGAAP